MIPAGARRLAWQLACATGLLYLAFLPPGIYSDDGNSMLAVAESIVAHHSLTVPAGLGIPGRGGEIYSAYYPLQSFLAAPFVGRRLFACDGDLGLLHYFSRETLTAFPSVPGVQQSQSPARGTTCVGNAILSRENRLRS